MPVMDERTENRVSPPGTEEWPPDNLPPEACSPQLRRRVLRLVPYFASLDAAELDQVNRVFRSHHMQRGETLTAEGETATTLYVIVSGRVKLTSLSASGAEHVLDVLGPGDSFGALPILGQERNDNGAEALTGGCLLMISSSEFAGLITTLPTVAVAVIEDVSARLRNAQERLKEATTAPVEARLASMLLTLSERFGEKTPSGRTLGVPLRQEELAALTGTTTETVNRTLAIWRNAGWVRTGRLRIELTDLAALKSATEHA